MLVVALTAFGVGGATVLGAIFGFLFKKSSAKTGDVVLGFAAGVMMAASVVGLITPSLSLGGKYGIFVTVAEFWRERSSSVFWKPLYKKERFCPKKTAFLPKKSKKYCFWSPQSQSIICLRA